MIVHNRRINYLTYLWEQEYGAKLYKKNRYYQTLKLIIFEPKTTIQERQAYEAPLVKPLDSSICAIS